MTLKTKKKWASDVTSYEEWLNNLKIKVRQNLLSEGINEKNIKEFEKSGLVYNIAPSIKNEKQRLVCQNCKTPFLVEISGNTALFSGESHSGAVIVKFKEMIGVCASCLEKDGADKAYSWLPSKEKHWRYIKKMTEFAPYVELLAYPQEYALEYIRNNRKKPKLEKTLETRYKDAVSDAVKSGTTNPQTLLKLLKKSLLGLPVEK
jgi:hypothetical protein